jgi:hypothetical protein
MGCLARLSSVFPFYIFPFTSSRYILAMPAALAGRSSNRAIIDCIL